MGGQYSTDADDEKFRRHHVADILEFLLKLKDNNVVTRNDLRPYLKAGSDIRLILMETGWLPLDPYYYFDHTQSPEAQEWLQARMILTDEAIRTALTEFLKPYNRNWANCLAEDFVNKN